MAPRRHRATLPSFAWSQVLAFRLARHHLSRRRTCDLAALCSDVCGVQAQVFSGAQLALWARAASVTRAEIRAALFDQHTLVKTASLRSTLHLHSVADFPVYIPALKASRLSHLLRVMARYGSVTGQESERVTQAVLDALASGPRTRAELTEQALARARVGSRARKFFELGWWGVVRAR